MILSVIIPVYNSGLYLKKCVESLLLQGLNETEYEIILINDGSTDNSLEICKFFTDKYPRIIKFVTKANEGVALTRNLGFNLARGEYIYFMDSDDYLIPYGFRYLVDTYISKQMDVLSFWAITLDKVILKSFVEKNEVKGHICFEGMGREFYRSNYCTFIWNHWYRRSFIEKNNIRFQPLIIGEDTLFNLHVYMANPSVVNVSSNLYRYVIHVDSATQVRKSNVIRKQIESYIVLLLELMKYYQLNKTKDFELAANLRKMVDQQCIPFMSRVLSSDYNNDEFKQLKSRLLLSEILPLSGNTKNERIINFLFKRPLTFVLFKQIYQKIFLPFVLPKLSKN